MTHPPSTIFPSSIFFCSWWLWSGIPYIMVATREDLQAGHCLGLYRYLYLFMMRKSNHRWNFLLKPAKLKVIDKQKQSMFSNNIAWAERLIQFIPPAYVVSWQTFVTKGQVASPAIAYIADEAGQQRSNPHSILSLDVWVVVRPHPSLTAMAPSAKP